MRLRQTIFEYSDTLLEETAELPSYIDAAVDGQHLIHLNFPYNPGDVLLIASDGQGADKIIPTLTYERKDNPQRNDAQWNGIGTTNLQLKTSNGYSPNMFPEFITECGYYYGAAARPGFVGRFVVGETLMPGAVLDQGDPSPKASSTTT